MYFSDIHHIAIICSDYERSKNFYTQILGFSIIRETYREGRKSFKLDLKVNANTQVELFSFEQPPKRLTQPEACGLRHLAFAVADLDLVVHYLRESNITVEQIRLDELTGKRFTFFHDPDGTPLEIYES
ncbi:MAG: VOC family protein [Candidatus Abawacabacteria bacterium]|nr:VOC family protein [Candidatus Abawacabacteria bacterium]